MNDQDHATFDPRIADWLEGDPNDAPDRALQVVLAAFPSVKQRHAMRLPWRYFEMLSAPKLAIGAVAVAAVVLGGGALYVAAPGQGTGGQPSAPPSATPSPSARTTAAPSVAPPSAAQGFVSTYFDVPLSLTLVDGWRLDGDDVRNVDLQHGVTDLRIMRMAHLTVPGPTRADPFIPLPADLGAWLAQRPEFGPVTTREVTVGGRKGTLLDADFTWDGSSKYAFMRDGTSGWLYDRLTAGSRGRFIVLPGPDDTGVVIHMESPIDGFDATAASLDQLLTTLQFR